MAENTFGPIHCSPFEKPACPTPDAAGDEVAARGGWDLGEGSQKETENLSGLPTLPHLMKIPNAPGFGEHIAADNAVASPSSPHANILKKDA